MYYTTSLTYKITAFSEACTFFCSTESRMQLAIEIFCHCCGNWQVNSFLIGNYWLRNFQPMFAISVSSLKAHVNHFRNCTKNWWKNNVCPSRLQW